MSVNRLGFCVVFIHATKINIQLCLSGIIPKKVFHLWMYVPKEAWLIHIDFWLLLWFLAGFFNREI